MNLHCLLCDQPVGGAPPYQPIASAFAHTSCLANLVRREITHRPKPRPPGTRSTSPAPADPPPAQRWAPIKPTGSQRQFLALTCREALYAGGCGSGKSTALLLAALQGMDTPGYRALLVTRHYRDLTAPGGLLDTTERWLRDTTVLHVNGGQAWTFPSGARLILDFLGDDRYADRFAGQQFQYIGLDDLHQFEIEQYEALWSHLHPLPGLTVPVRLRATATDDRSALPEWLYRHFFQARYWRDPSVTVILADAAENPYVTAGATN